MLGTRRGSIVKSQFFIKNDVPECIDFHFAGGRVPSKLAIVDRSCYSKIL